MTSNVRQHGAGDHAGNSWNYDKNGSTNIWPEYQNDPQVSGDLRFDYSPYWTQYCDVTSQGQLKPDCQNAGYVADDHRMCLRAGPVDRPFFQDDTLESSVDDLNSLPPTYCPGVMKAKIAREKNHPYYGAYGFIDKIGDEYRMDAFVREDLAKLKLAKKKLGDSSAYTGRTAESALEEKFAKGSPYVTRLNEYMMDVRTMDPLLGTDQYYTDGAVRDGKGLAARHRLGLE